MSGLEQGLETADHGIEAGRYVARLRLEDRVGGLDVAQLHGQPLLGDAGAPLARADRTLQAVDRRVQTVQGSVQLRHAGRPRSPLGVYPFQASRRLRPRVAGRQSQALPSMPLISRASAAPR